MNFLAWLYHQHHWETIDKRELRTRDEKQDRVGIVYVLKCKDCGDIKYREFP